MLISKIDHDERHQSLTWLAADVAFIIIPTSERQELPRSLQAPYGSVLVEGPNGPMRVVALRRPTITLPKAALQVPIRSGVSTSAFALFDDLGVPRHEPEINNDAGFLALHSEHDPVALAELLDHSGRRRFLDFLLGFCLSAFRLTDNREFAAVCAQVAGLCCTPTGTATPIAEVPPGRVLLRGVEYNPGDTIYLIGPHGTRMIRAPSGHVAQGAGDLLVVPTPLAADWLIASGAKLRIWQIAAAETLPHVMSLTGQALAAARAACVRALSPAAHSSAEAALLRELHLLAPAAPRRHDDPGLPLGGALELAVPDGNGGVFLSGWLRDPLDLIVGAELLTPAGCESVAGDALYRVSRPDLKALLAKSAPAGAGANRAGFVARLNDPTGGAALQPSLRLLLRSGAAIELTPPLRPLPPHLARDAVLSSVPPAEVQPEILKHCLVPAASGLHHLARLQRGTERVVRIGPRASRPEVSILIPLYRVLGFLRFQLCAFAEDPVCRASEIIYVLDSPEQADEVEHLLRGLHYLLEMSVTLVVMERNGGFSAATNAAARHAAGRSLLLLNSDVIPVGPGWLKALLEARTRSGAVAATAKLLFDDGSLQHAGLYFASDADGIWFNNHYHKGLPGAWPGADAPRRVPGGTGAALLVDRAHFERCGGVCEDYVVGDYEDSDLCLRLQESGGFIVYEPGAVLYHFERRSIALHPGYTRTLACQYNRHVHHERWADAIATLMAMPEFRQNVKVGL